MKLPTPIPDSLHLDLDQPGQIEVDVRTDSMIQAAMIRVHQSVMSWVLGRNVPILEAADDWEESGLADLYRQHYARKQP